MKRFGNVLFPTDFSEISDATLAHADYVCNLYSSRLHIVHANPMARPENSEKQTYHLIDQTEWSPMFQEYVESLDRGKSGAQNLVTAEVADKSVPDALLHYAERNAIDLIVLGTHGRRGLGRMLLGSTAEEVVRLSRCPVMTVGGKAIDSLDPRIDRMLVPIDFSDFSLEALDVAKQLATALKAQMDLIHVIQPIVVPSSYGITFPPVTSPEVLERARKALEDLGGNLGAFKGNTSVEHGIPADKITAYAKEKDVDLIVMASHGLTGFDRFIQGSVSQEVIRLAPCPVYTEKIRTGTKS